MTAHRYAAILVFVLSAIWVLTGDFSFVGSAASENEQLAASVEEPSVTPAQAAEGKDAAGHDLQTVGVAVIPSIEHARSVRVSGVTSADKEINVTARTQGIIAELTVRQGDVVRAGDVILRLDPEGRDAQLRSAEQALEEAKSQFEARRVLVERGTVAKLQLDTIRSAVIAAESAVEAAKAEIERLVVTAPFDGVLDVINVEQGGSVEGGTPVARLIALDPIIGIGEVNESDLGIVKIGSPAQLRLVTGDVLDGTIRYVSRVAQATTRTFTVEVEVPNADLAIPAGMTAEVILRGEPVLATPVPRSVITLNEDGDLGVRTVDENDEVAFHMIDIVDDSTGALILGGIPKDARVIVSGQNIVADGEKVIAKPIEQSIIDGLIKEVQMDMAVQ